MPRPTAQGQEPATALEVRLDIGAVGLDLAIEALRSGHPVRLRLLGQSMKPRIMSGDIVEITPVAEPDQCEIGDVVCLARDDGRLVVHRLVGWLPTSQGTRILTRGDSRSEPDGPWNVDQLLGRVAIVEPAASRPIHHRLAARARQAWRWVASRTRDRVVRLAGVLRRSQAVRRLQRALFVGTIDYHLLRRERHLESDGGILVSLTVTAIDSRRRLVGKFSATQQPPDSADQAPPWLANCLWVRPRWRGLGISRELTRHVLDAVAQNGGGPVYALVAPQNVPSLALLASCGKKVGTPPPWIARLEDFVGFSVFVLTE